MCHNTAVRMEVMGARAVNIVLGVTYAVIVLAVAITLLDRRARLGDLFMPASGYCSDAADSNGADEHAFFSADDQISVSGARFARPTCQFLPSFARQPFAGGGSSAGGSDDHDGGADVSLLPSMWISPRLTMHTFNFPFAFEMEIVPRALRNGDVTTIATPTAKIANSTLDGSGGSSGVTWTTSNSLVATHVSVLLLPPSHGDVDDGDRSEDGLSLQANHTAVRLIREVVSAAAAAGAVDATCELTAVQACARHRSRIECELPATGSGDGDSGDSACFWCGTADDGACWPLNPRFSIDASPALQSTPPSTLPVAGATAAMAAASSTAACVHVEYLPIGYTVWQLFLSPSSPVPRCPIQHTPLPVDAAVAAHTLSRRAKHVMQTVECEAVADGDAAAAAPCDIETMPLSSAYRRSPAAPAPTVTKQLCDKPACGLMRTSWLLNNDDYPLGKAWQLKMLEDVASHASDRFDMVLVLRSDRNLDAAGDVSFKLTHTRFSYVALKSSLSLLFFVINAAGLVVFVYFLRRHKRLGGNVNREQNMVVLALIWCVALVSSVFLFLFCPDLHSSFICYAPFVPLLSAYMSLTAICVYA